MDLSKVGIIIRPSAGDASEPMVGSITLAAFTMLIDDY